ncbi:MAG TPA: hypothetical protein VG963_24380 [Polyangiaceae bacterium]|nr:hypothetical protein [Polyangiaceae bacterium]
MQFPSTLPDALLAPSSTRAEESRVIASGTGSKMSPVRPVETSETEHDDALPAELQRHAHAVFDALAAAGARLDAAAHGKRGAILGVSVIVSAFGNLARAPLLEYLGIVLFWAAAALFGIARFAVSPEGRGWSAATLFWKEFEAPFAHAASTLEACVKSWAKPLPKGADLDRIHSNSTLLKTIGVTGYPIAYFLGSEAVPILALAVCFGYAGEAWCVWKRPSLRSSAESCENAARALPAVLEAAGVTAAADDPVLAALLDALASWRPRRRARESQYQLAFYRRITDLEQGAQLSLRESPALDDTGTMDGIDRARPLSVVGVDQIEAERSLDRAAQDREHSIARRRGVFLGKPRADGGHVSVIKHVEGEAQFVGIGVDHLDDGTQRALHGAARAGGESSEVHRRRVAVDRDRCGDDGEGRGRCGRCERIAFENACSHN